LALLVILRPRQGRQRDEEEVDDLADERQEGELPAAVTRVPDTPISPA